MELCFCLGLNIVAYSDELVRRGNFLRHLSLDVLLIALYDLNVFYFLLPQIIIYDL